MNDTIRKCIALRNSNKDFVDDLINEHCFNSFSHAINDMIEQNRRIRNGQKIDNHCEDSI